MIHLSKLPVLFFVLNAFLVVGSTSYAKPESSPAELNPGVNALLAPAAAFPLDENSDPAAIRIEELRTQLAELNLELLALKEDGQTSKGDDALALWSRSIELRLDAAVALGTWADDVATLAAADHDVTKYRQQLKGLLPGATLAAQALFATVQQSIADASAKLEAGGDDTSALQASLDRYDAIAIRILAAAADQVQDLDRLELPAKPARDWLSKQLERRARLGAARIHLASLKLADAEAAAAISPDDTTLSAAVALQTARLTIHDDSLAAVIGMMDTVELDTARYQRILIESTGELTASTFDSGVVGDLTTRWLASAKEAAFANGPNIIFQTLIFALVVTFFWSASRLVRRIIEQALAHSKIRLSTLLTRMIISLASGSVLFAGVLIAFSQLGLEVAPLLAGLGIAGFVLGFALQETLANFASGIMILAYRPYDVQDLIECAGGVFGRVNNMNLVSTTILTLDNQTLVVPNGKIWGDVITNVTAQSSRRVDLVFGISYSDDIPHTEKVLQAIVEEHPKVRDEPEPIVKLHELGDSSVNFVVRPWVAMEDYWDVYWDVTREVKLRFDREGISIPFPQRDVHFPSSAPQLPTQSPTAVGATPSEAQDPPESGE
jgi:small conductance mechanosensitive channel